MIEWNLSRNSARIATTPLDGAGAKGDRSNFLPLTLLPIDAAVRNLDPNLLFLPMPALSPVDVDRRHRCAVTKGDYTLGLNPGIVSGRM